MRKLSLLLCLTLGACATFPIPQTPAQTVFEAEGVYHAALALEVKYDKLPRCLPATPPLICSDLAVVKKIKQIDVVTWANILVAQKTVRTPGFGDNVLQSAAIAARNAAQAFAQQTAQLKVK